MDKREYPQHPRVGVGAVIWRGDQLLLVKRGKPPRLGAWTLPGGGQELGESVTETAIREIREETGLAVTILGVAAVIDLKEQDEAGAWRYHYTVIDLIAEWQAGEARAASDVAAVAWVTLADLGDYDLSPQTLAVIAQAAKRRTGVEAVPAL